MNEEATPVIYELRTYTLRPRSTAVYEERFGEALPYRERHSKLAAFWHTEIGPLNQVIHLWPYEDLKHREEVRAAAAREGAGHWPPKGDDVLLRMESDILVPAPFMRPLTGQKQELGNVYELRIYTYQVGAIPRVVERWSEAVPGREKHSPLAGAWYSDIGGLNRWFHLWPYADLAARDRIRGEATKEPGWPPQTGEWLVSQENKILVPAAFSPLH